MKRAIAIVLSFMFVFALCACGGDDDNKGIVGKWEMDTYEAPKPLSDAFNCTAEAYDDKTFAAYATTSVGTELVLSGVYEENGDEITFNCKHQTSKFNGVTAMEKDIDKTLKGKLDGDKLTIDMPESFGMTKLIMKRK